MNRVAQSRRPDRLQRHKAPFAAGEAPSPAPSAVPSPVPGVNGAKLSRPAALPREAAPAGRQPERWLLERLLRSCGNPPLEFELWNGQRICLSPEPIARIRLLDRGTFWKVVVDPRMHFGEAYADGRLEVEGDLVEMMLAVDRALVRTGQTDFGANHPLRWLRLRRRNDPNRARQNVQHHYDIGNEFYRLWLDEQLLYTCAYFAEPDCTLEQAQVAKMDHVCRKVWLRPGEAVIDAGCGWGALALHMARKYGVTVRAFNTSREQIAFARGRARDEGLAGRVEFVEEDWRAITGGCDAFVSVGMLEHVGPANYRELGRVINGCLAPGGRGLIHSIGRNRPHATDPWIERRIFPGAYPPSLREMMDIFEPGDFSLLDVENLRRHYALTLRHWLARFERSVDEVQRMFDPRFARMWRFYLSGSTSAFEAGALQLFQVVFARGSNHDVPRTRRHQYSQEMPPAPEWFPPQGEGMPGEPAPGNGPSAGGGPCSDATF